MLRAALRTIFTRAGALAVSAPDAAASDPARMYATYYDMTLRVSAAGAAPDAGAEPR